MGTWTPKPAYCVSCDCAGRTREIRNHAIHSLLLLCSRTRLDDAAIAGIRALSGHGLNRTELFIAAAEHAVAQLVCQRLDDLAGEALPPLWRQQSCQAFARNVRRNLFQTSELFRVLAVLGTTGVRAVPHKGLRLGPCVWRHCSAPVQRPRHLSCRSVRLSRRAGRRLAPATAPSSMKSKHRKHRVYRDGFPASSLIVMKHPARHKQG
jgi:hypothetical protein